MNNTIATSALLILLAACSTSNDEPASEKDDRRKVLTDAVNQPLDKAKEVEQQILDNAAEQRKQVDDL